MYILIKNKTLVYDQSQINDTIIISRLNKLINYYDNSCNRFLIYFENYERIKNIVSYFIIFYLFSIEIVLWLEKLTFKNLEFIYDTCLFVRKCLHELNYLYIDQEEKYSIINIDSIIANTKKENETVEYESFIRDLVSNIPDKTINIKRSD
jgi:hypothetical protein